MRELLRKLYYFLNVIRVRLSRKKITASLSSQIRNIDLLEGCNKIGNNSYLNGEMGKYSYLGNGCRMVANIGRYCSISNNVKTVDGTHPLYRLSTSPVFYSTSRQCGVTFVDHDTYSELVQHKTTIGNDVWIGENVIIKGGITIGDGAVVAMGSVVTKNVAPYTIVAGVPAKKIKSRFDQNHVNVLMKLQWWNKSEDWIKKNISFFSSEENMEDVINLLQEERM